MHVLLIDPQDLARAGVKFLLRALPGELRVSEADSVPCVRWHKAMESGFDLILVDPALDGLKNLSDLRWLCSEFAEPPVVVLSQLDDSGLVRDAIDAGAAGFIPKSADSQVIISALQIVLSGNIYVPPSVLLRPSANGGSHSMNVDGPGKLTPRQMDVLRLLAQGLSNKEIARRLDLSPGTVKLHVTQILRALDVHNRTEAVVASAHLLNGSAEIGAVPDPVARPAARRTGEGCRAAKRRPIQCRPAPKCAPIRAAGATGRGK